MIDGLRRLPLEVEADEYPNGSGIGAGVAAN